MKFARCTAAVVMVLALSFAFAQEKKTSTQKPSGKPAATSKEQKPGGAMMMAKPPAEMQKVNFMLGKWQTSEKFEPSEWMPKGGTGTGMADLHPTAGGMSLVEDYKSKSGFSGHAVLWWDAKAQAYKSFWCDSMSSCQPSFGTGKWEGDKLVFTGESEAMGKKYAMKQTFSDIKPGSFTWSEEAAIDGGPMKPSMSIKYKKAGGAKPAAKPNPKM